MESIVFEICSSESDPSDRTLSVMIRSGERLIAAQSFRVDPGAPFGDVLLAIDRMALLWQAPSMDEWQHIYDSLEAAAESLSSPF